MKQFNPFRGVLCALLLSPCLLFAQVSNPCASDGQKFDLEHPGLREMIEGRVQAFLADKAEGQQKIASQFHHSGGTTRHAPARYGFGHS